MKSETKQKGFTLMEVIIVVAIVGILSAVITPVISAMLPRYYLRAEARELLINFKKAKIDAVKRNRTVFIQFTPETVGDPEKGGSYLVWVDDNRNSVCDAGENLQTINMPRNVRLTTNKNLVGYTSRGLPWNNQFGTATLKSSGGNGTRVYVITLGPAGKVQMQ